VEILERLFGQKVVNKNKGAYHDRKQKINRSNSSHHSQKNSQEVFGGRKDPDRVCRNIPLDIGIGNVTNVAVV
jgi:hypothetical protein